MSETPTSSAGLFSAAELAESINATIVGEGTVMIRRVDAMDRADAQTLTFIRDGKRAREWDACPACAAIVSKDAAADLSPGDGRALLIVDDADLALLNVLESIAPQIVQPEDGVHASAVIHPEASIGEGARIGPFVVVGEGSRIGSDCALHAGVRIGAGVTVGDGCEMRANVVVEDRCVLGDRVTLHPGCVIGADGFGYRPAPDGAGILKIPHAGSVRIGSDVEIGANTTIDRGKFGDTEVGDGSKIDNLVQIGHNCRIGRCCVICGAAGIAGSVVVGDGATIGGGAGIRDNVTIGAGAQVGARSGVMADIPAGQAWGGAPAMPIKDAMRSYAAWRSLPKTLRALEKRLKEIEDRQNET